MAVSAQPRVVHALPGRMRVHVPAWSGADPAALEARLGRSRGVARVRASGRTRNVLVEYDGRRLDEAAVLRRLRRAVRDAPTTTRARREAAHAPPANVLVTASSARRARIAVPGLDRDPDLARRLVERIGRRADVRRVVPSPLTGRVLVEFRDAVEDLQGILDDIADVAPPDGAESHVPAHPLDPAPIIEGAARVAGAALGLALLLGRRAAGSTAAPVSGPGPGEVAGGLVLLEGVPPVAHRLEDALGHERKELLFAAIGVVSMTSAGGALGLAFAGAGGLRVLTEALARRSAWRGYERRVGDETPAYPGAVLVLEAGRRAPMRGRVLDGAAIGQAADGRPQPLVAGSAVEPGVRVHGGPVTIELTGDEPGASPPRAVAPAGAGPASLQERYLGVLPYAALVAGLGTAVVTRSLAHSLTALLIVNPRPALAGGEHADRGAAARVLRAGVTVVGSRAERPVRRPDIVVLDAARTVCDGWEVREAAPLEPARRRAGLLALAGAVAVAGGSPWGAALAGDGQTTAVDGAFDGATATATVDGERWSVGPARAGDDGGPAAEPGDARLVVCRERDGRVAGVVVLRARPAGGTAALVAACAAHDVRLEIVAAARSAAAADVARRAGVPLVVGATGQHVAALRSEGFVVAVVGDSAASGAAFEAADLAVGLTSGLSGRFGARADLLAPRLEAVAAIVEAGARRDAALRDGTLLSVAANAAGAAWAIRAAPPFRAAGRPVLIGGLAAMLDAAVRLGGGRRERTVVERLADPVPEQWGRLDADAVLQRLGTTRDGLTWEAAAQRWTAPEGLTGRRLLLDAVLRQLASPLAAFLAGGAALSLGMGAVGDAAMIGAVIVANALIGAWQERQAGQATRALQEMGPPIVRVLRNGREEDVPAVRLVPGDVLLLAPGDRVAADARLLEASNLEVDEAALTGESMPVVKAAGNGTDASRIVLEGTDVTTGSGRAVVVATGAATRMGAIAAALGEDGRGPSPLDERLGQIMWHALPFIVLGGALVSVPGIAGGRPAVEQLALGASMAIAAVPEGLPLLAGVAEAGVARRLARRSALVTRLSAVEALGRVDVACADKTGTLTTGRLVVRAVADPRGRTAPPDALPPDRREVLRVAAMASPAPGDAAAGAHPTDVAVLAAARAAGVGGSGPREAERPFDPVRSFSAAVVDGRLRVKGAVEALAPRCTAMRVGRRSVRLDDAGREALLVRAAALAAEGLRVLLVAEGPAEAALDDPEGLTALGFVAIGDPVRPTARAAVARCRAAGVRVLMLTGDHPATARAVARQIGLPSEPEDVLTGAELAALDDDALRGRLERATVIARSTPLDKLRIVEALRLSGHVVAMTGDGVNDAPALRLADVGVAMGRHGTEVARHAADLVLTDDDFATLAEALVEGRGFWTNMRRALGLLLGGNAGEVATIVATGLAGLGTPLTTRQVLTINLVSDVLPAMTVAMKAPEHRDLGALAREGGAALDGPLRAEILRRAAGTAVPSLAACLLAAGVLGPAAVGPVAFLSVMGTQLAQALAMGGSDGRPDPAVAAAVAGSVGALAVAAAFPPTRTFVGLGGVTPEAVAVALGASVAAPAFVRVLPWGRDSAA